MSLISYAESEDSGINDTSTDGGFDMAWIQVIMAGLQIGNTNTQNNIDQRQEDANLLAVFLSRDNSKMDVASLVFIVVGVIALIVVIKVK